MIVGRIVRRPLVVPGRSLVQVWELNVRCFEVGHGTGTEVVRGNERRGRGDGEGRLETCPTRESYFMRMGR